MGTSSSPLTHKLGHYTALNAQEEKMISSLMTEGFPLSKGSEISCENKTSDCLYILEKGWVASYTIMPDGRRQVLQIHFPGDIIGFADMAVHTPLHEFKALSDCVLHHVTKADICRLIDGSDKLAAVLISLVMIDHAVLLDRLRVMGRMNARERVIHFLLSVLTRLRLTETVKDNIFDFPLTQFDLADAIGLTNVSVSNALSDLQDKGVVKKLSGRMEILNEEYMREACCYVDRYETVDVSWYPGLTGIGK